MKNSCIERNRIVGAPGVASNATGVDGDQTNTNSPVSGAVYVFTGLAAPSPQLAIEQSGGHVRLLWPLPAADFVLDQTSDINPLAVISWTQVPFPYQTNVADVSITLPWAVGSKFYRLRKP